MIRRTFLPEVHNPERPQYLAKVYRIADFRRKLYFNLLSCLHTLVATPGRAERQEIIIAIKTKRAAVLTAIDRPGHMVTLSITPDFSRFERDHNNRFTARFYDRSLKALYVHGFAFSHRTF